MGLYTPESLAQLRQRIDLVSVLSSHIDLKPAGGYLKACCPFHEERSPSFMLRRGDTHYHCFGCGAHGDAIQFLMHHLRYSFREAVEHLADRFHVVLESSRGNSEKGPNKPALRDALEKAVLFFHYCLLHTQEGHEALDYLYARGISLELICRFRLGWAPRDEGLLAKILTAQQVELWQLRESGLIREGGQRCLFHNRITIPIRDPQGQMVGFSARKMGDEPGPKYINTHETPLFKKSHLLFGLDSSRRRIAKERRVLIVEGQIDALRLIHAGFDWTVAGQGTAFGEHQVRALTQLGVKQALLMFDGDSAGQEATIKVGHLLLKEGVEVRVVRLPADMDPDSLLRREGPEKLSSCIESAIDYLTFLVEHGAQEHSRSPAAKGQWVADVTAKIREWNNPVLIHESLSRLASLLGLPPDTLSTNSSVPMRQRAVAGSVQVDTHRILETDLLRWLVLMGPAQPSLVSMATSNYPASKVRTPLCQRVYSAIA
jgi:DNA primase